MFLSDKIILIIDKYTRIICYRDEVTKIDMEIIVKFKNEKNIEQIFNDIVNSKIKYWLEKRKFHSNGPDELDITEKGCQLKLINKNLKLIIKSQRNRIDNQSDTTKFFKYNLPQDLKNEMQYHAQEIFQNTQANFFNVNQNYEIEIKRYQETLDIYKKENEKLKADLIRANKIISDIQKNNLNNNELINLRNENNSLKYQLTLKENEINDLKNKLQNNHLEDIKVNYKDIMVVNFISMDSSVQFGVKCLPTDVFAVVEEELYKRYDNLRNTNNMFTANAKPVLRFKKIWENNIKDGDIIQLFKLE